MKLKFLKFICIFILLGLAGFLLVPDKQELIQPYLTRYKSTSNIWTPQVLGSSLTPDAPEVTSAAAYFIDTDTGQVLYQKNIHQKMPIASLIKIMTVIVTLEHKKFDDKVWVSQRAADMEPDHMILQAGETLTVKDLLDGIFLVSANDASEALAENVFGDREIFIDAMNEKAKQLGMNDTVFINPSGLEEDGRTHYSTAYDVALMSRYAIKTFPQLVDISSQPHVVIPKTETHQDYEMYSGINLLTTYPGVVGFKTGYTPEAGLTLVTLARKDGHEVLGVLLNSQNRRDDAKILLDYSFEKLR
jgi:serine-type D-Ala-D-Ala carboxypeptidase (penicillin-binding protein 5/6)